MKNKLIIAILTLSICLCSFVFSGCNDQIVDHEIFLTSQNINLGRAEGAGTYKTNEEVTITAIPTLEDDSFILWMKNGFVISYENPYTFTASKETEGKYTAVFASENQDLVSLTGINYEESFITETTLTQISKVNIYLDNREYYQTLNLSIENLMIDDNYFITHEVSGITPEFILDYTLPIYAKIEITYLKEDNGGNVLTYSKTTNKTFTLENYSENVSIKLNTIADAVNVDNKPELILTFSPLEKKSIEDEPIE